jgi:hypothetical protein
MSCQNLSRCLSSLLFPHPSVFEYVPTHSIRPYTHPYTHTHTSIHTSKHTSKHTYIQRYIHTYMNASALFLPELLALRWHAFDPKLEKLEQTQGQEGRGMLVSRALNIYLGPLEDRVLVTGLSTVRDVHCRLCTVFTPLPCHILPAPADASIARRGLFHAIALGFATNHLLLWQKFYIKRGNRIARS